MTDACDALLDEAVRLTGTGRALVYLSVDDALHGHALGVPDDRVASLLASRGAVSRRLRDLLDEGSPIRLTDGEILAALGFGTATAIPFPAPGGAPAGALLLEGEVAAPAMDRMRRTLAAAGPHLARMVEIDQLRSRLRRQERDLGLLDALFHSFADPVVLTDRDNRFIFANRRAEALFSTRPEESEDRRRAVRINDLTLGSFLTQSLISGSVPPPRELNLVDPDDGSDLLFEVTSVPLPATLGREGATISVLRDITDLKRALSALELQFSRSRAAEQAARQESDRLGVVIENMGDPILVTDEKSTIILMNDQAERLFEPRPEIPDAEAVGRTVRANGAKFTALISDFLRQPSARRVENLILQDPVTGQELAVEVVSSKITDHRGQVTAIVSILHDLTSVVENERLARELQVLNEGLAEHIRMATEELEERNRRLEWQSRELKKASRLKSEFLASMSHELRTPINAMLGYTALLREEIYGALNEKQESALGKVYGASQHLLALINDILDLSKIEAGKMPVRLESVRLAAVIGELGQTIEPLVREKNLAYTTRLDERLPALETDRTKVKQILLNLLSNAVKFTAEGEVAVHAFPIEEGRLVRIEVRDTGIGIEPHDQETIFDDFRQVDQTPTRRYGGTGLGLSITRKLVRLLGGAVSVESVSGRGSVFRVDLPITLDEDGGAEGGDVHLQDAAGMGRQDPQSGAGGSGSSLQ